MKQASGIIGIIIFVLFVGTAFASPGIIINKIDGYSHTDGQIDRIMVALMLKPGSNPIDIKDIEVEVSANNGAKYRLVTFNNQEVNAVNFDEFRQSCVPGELYLIKDRSVAGTGEETPDRFLESGETYYIGACIADLNIGEDKDFHVTVKAPDIDPVTLSGTTPAVINGGTVIQLASCAPKGRISVEQFGNNVSYKTLLVGSGVDVCVQHTAECGSALTSVNVDYYLNDKQLGSFSLGRIGFAEKKCWHITLKDEGRYKFIAESDQGKIGESIVYAELPEVNYPPCSTTVFAISEAPNSPGIMEEPENYKYLVTRIACVGGEPKLRDLVVRSPYIREVQQTDYVATPSNNDICEIGAGNSGSPYYTVTIYEHKPLTGICKISTQKNGEEYVTWYVSKFEFNRIKLAETGTVVRVSYDFNGHRYTSPEKKIDTFHAKMGNNARIIFQDGPAPKGIIIMSNPKVTYDPEKELLHVSVNSGDIINVRVNTDFEYSIPVNGSKEITAYVPCSKDTQEKKVFTLISKNGETMGFVQSVDTKCQSSAKLSIEGVQGFGSDGQIDRMIVILRNTGSETIDLKDLKFNVQTTDGRIYEAFDGEKMGNVTEGMFEALAPGEITRVGITKDWEFLKAGEIAEIGIVLQNKIKEGTAVEISVSGPYVPKTSYTTKLSTCKPSARLDIIRDPKYRDRSNEIVINEPIKICLNDLQACGGGVSPRIRVMNNGATVMAKTATGEKGKRYVCVDYRPTMPGEYDVVAEMYAGTAKWSAEKEFTVTKPKGSIEIESVKGIARGTDKMRQLIITVKNNSNAPLDPHEVIVNVSYGKDDKMVGDSYVGGNVIYEPYDTFGKEYQSGIYYLTGPWTNGKYIEPGETGTFGIGLSGSIQEEDKWKMTLEFAPYFGAVASGTAPAIIQGDYVELYMGGNGRPTPPKPRKLKVHVSTRMDGKETTRIPEGAPFEVCVHAEDTNGKINAVSYTLFREGKNFGIAARDIKYVEDGASVFNCFDVKGMDVGTYTVRGYAKTSDGRSASDIEHIIIYGGPTTTAAEKVKKIATILNRIAQRFDRIATILQRMSDRFENVGMEKKSLCYQEAAMIASSESQYVSAKATDILESGQISKDNLIGTIHDILRATGQLKDKIRECAGVRG